MNYNISIVGGDEREIEAGKELKKSGFTVRITGFEKFPPNHSLEMVTLDKALKSADVVIMPLPGTSDEGVIYALYNKKDIILNGEILENVKSEALFFIGKAKPFLKHYLKSRKIKFFETAEMDELAILNSIPTAEGAIQLAMEKTKITIHGSRSMVIGFGRCGLTLARAIYGLGAKVTVTASGDNSLARAYEMGFEPLPINQLEKQIGEFEIVYNTVPAMILKKELIEKLDIDSLIIDISSSPGGIDFKAAKKRGIKAFLVPGLPGQVAPKTAGLMLANIYSRLIKRHYKYFF